MGAAFHGKGWFLRLVHGAEKADEVIDIAQVIFRRPSSLLLRSCSCHTIEPRAAQDRGKIRMNAEHLKGSRLCVKYIVPAAEASSLS